MDNVIIPYQEINDTSSENTDDSSDNDELYKHKFSNNIGIHYNNFNNQDKFFDQEKVQEYENIRNKYFTPEISKIRLLLNSKILKHHNISPENHNTSNYTIYFEGDDSSNNINNTTDLGNINNVIGFKLIKATIPNTIYTINGSNTRIHFQWEGPPPVPDANGIITLPIFFVDLIPGKYTFTQLGDHLKTLLNNISGTEAGIGSFNVLSDINTYKYTILNQVQRFKINFQSADNELWKRFGFLKSVTEFNNNHVSHNVVQQTIHFVDLVIPEIPQIACKKNFYNKNVIDRIPVNETSGSLVHYENEDNLDNYFYPINISKLNIQLYEDGKKIYDCQNGDNSFEFEITILNK